MFSITAYQNKYGKRPRFKTEVANRSEVAAISEQLSQEGWTDIRVLEKRQPKWTSRYGKQ
jgi:hypothetical protein